MYNLNTLPEQFKTFDLRCKLTSKLILQYKNNPDFKNEYHILEYLIKSDIYEDLILAQEIMNKLAI